ncbi:MAG: hypothetical protein S4CHLAM102_14430 [Chlamydiia bacterium]|nr:hypothetical protein [Chlamydiia bacterium]
MDQKQVSRALAPLYSVIFLSFIGIGIMIPVFTSMFLTSGAGFVSPGLSLGNRLILLGLILSVYPLGQATGTPLWGHQGGGTSKKRRLLLSVGLSFIGYVSISLAVYFTSLIWLFISLFFTGMAEGNIKLVMNAIADATEGEHRERHYGYSYCTMALAFVLGPILAGVFGDQALTQAFGYETPFWIVTILLAIVWVWILFGKEYHHPPGGEIEGHLKESTPLHKRLLSSSQLKWSLVSNFFLYMGLFGFLRIFPMILVVDYRLGLGELAWMVGYTFLPAAISNLFIVSPFAKWKDSRWVTIISGAIFAVLLLIASVTTSMVGFWVVIFLSNFALGFVLTFSSLTLTRLPIPNNERNKGLGHNQMILIESEAFSSILAGIITAIFLPLSLWVAALFVIVGICLQFQIRKEGRKESHKG